MKFRASGISFLTLVGSFRYNGIIDTTVEEIRTRNWSYLVIVYKTRYRENKNW